MTSATWFSPTLPAYNKTTSQLTLNGDTHLDRDLSQINDRPPVSFPAVIHQAAQVGHFNIKHIVKSTGAQSPKAPIWFNCSFWTLTWKNPTVKISQQFGSQPLIKTTVLWMTLGCFSVQWKHLFVKMKRATFFKGYEICNFSYSCLCLKIKLQVNLCSYLQMGFQRKWTTIDALAQYLFLENVTDLSFKTSVFLA